MTDVPDHPVIRNAERTGWFDGKEPKYPHCPECGAECYHIYTNATTGEILGCDVCIDENPAWEIDACFPYGKAELEEERSYI